MNRNLDFGNVFCRVAFKDHSWPLMINLPRGCLPVHRMLTDIGKPPFIACSNRRIGTLMDYGNAANARKLSAKTLDLYFLSQRKGRFIIRFVPVFPRPCTGSWENHQCSAPRFDPETYTTARFRTSCLCLPGRQSKWLEFL